ncbi:MAG: hypothetical protein QM784_15990 [Polyangiaceae bacterium]
MDDSKQPPSTDSRRPKPNSSSASTDPSGQEAAASLQRPRAGKLPLGHSSLGADTDEGWGDPEIEAALGRLSESPPNVSPAKSAASIGAGETEEVTRYYERPSVSAPPASSHSAEPSTGNSAGESTFTSPSTEKRKTEIRSENPSVARSVRKPGRDDGSEDATHYYRRPEEEIEAALRERRKSTTEDEAEEPTHFFERSAFGLPPSSRPPAPLEPTSSAVVDAENASSGAAAGGREHAVQVAKGAPAVSGSPTKLPADAVLSTIEHAVVDVQESAPRSSAKEPRGPSSTTASRVTDASAPSRASGSSVPSSARPAGILGLVGSVFCSSRGDLGITGSRANRRCEQW